MKQLVDDQDLDKNKSIQIRIASNGKSKIINLRFTVALFSINRKLALTFVKLKGHSIVSLFDFLSLRSKRRG